MPCTSCGAPLDNRAACQTLFDELVARAWTDPQLAAVHNLVVDAYSLQHPEEYCESAKSYAAHLTGVCWALEFGGDATAYWAIPRWLDGRTDLQRPPTLRHRGTATIADVHAAASTPAYRQTVNAWAAEVWNAYGSQHDLARTWMHAVIADTRLRR